MKWKTKRDERNIKRQKEKMEEHREAKRKERK
jgi:hypothetical protein